MQLIELCAGSGALGISTTLKNAHYVKKLLLLDNKPDAILSADMNLKKHEVEGVSRLPSTEFGRPKIARR